MSKNKDKLSAFDQAAEGDLQFIVAAMECVLLAHKHEGEVEIALPLLDEAITKGINLQNGINQIQKIKEL